MKLCCCFNWFCWIYWVVFSYYYYGHFIK